jgi:hypothetical protein
MTSHVKPTPTTAACVGMMYNPITVIVLVDALNISNCVVRAAATLAMLPVETT